MLYGVNRKYSYKIIKFSVIYLKKNVYIENGINYNKFYVYNKKRQSLSMLNIDETPSEA